MRKKIPVRRNFIYYMGTMPHGRRDGLPFHTPGICIDDSEGQLSFHNYPGPPDSSLCQEDVTVIAGGSTLMKC